MKCFQNSNKKHLIITGNRHVGKTTLVNLIRSQIEIQYGFTTHAYRKDKVVLNDISSNLSAIIGKYSEIINTPENKMLPCVSGFTHLAIPIIEKFLKSDNDSYFFIDELGFLESNCTNFQKAIYELLDNKKVIAVLRKQSTIFLDSIKKRDDVFCYDMDNLILPVGCIIMASGQSRRFGSNKLLTKFHGKTLIEQTLEMTDTQFLKSRVVVTRYSKIKEICDYYNVNAVLHDFPDRNDTVRIGLNELLKSQQYSGYIFTPTDQPLLTKKSLEKLIAIFSIEQSINNKISDVYRCSYYSEKKRITVIGTPVLFGNNYLHSLLHLPPKKGGIYAVKNKEYIKNVFVDSEYELFDVDTIQDLKQIEKIHI